MPGAWSQEPKGSETWTSQNSTYSLHMLSSLQNMEFLSWRDLTSEMLAYSAPAGICNFSVFEPWIWIISVSLLISKNLDIHPMMAGSTSDPYASQSQGHKYWGTSYPRTRTHVNGRHLASWVSRAWDSKTLVNGKCISIDTQPILLTEYKLSAEIHHSTGAYWICGEQAYLDPAPQLDRDLLPCMESSWHISHIGKLLTPLSP